MAEVRTMMIWCPDWPVHAATQAAGAGPDEPVAVLDKGRVVACSAAARADGIRRGLRARDAQSRCPELVVLAYDPVIDARAFEPVVAALEALVPGVQIVRPGMCAIRARGPRRFYGSEEKAAEKLLDRLETVRRAGQPDRHRGRAVRRRAGRPGDVVAAPGPAGRAGGVHHVPRPAQRRHPARPELTDLLRRLGPAHPRRLRRPAREPRC